MNARTTPDQRLQAAAGQMLEALQLVSSAAERIEYDTGEPQAELPWSVIEAVQAAIDSAGAPR